MSHRSVTLERPVLPGLLLTTLPPSAAGRKGRRHLPPRDLASIPLTACWESLWKCYLSAFPPLCYVKVIPAGRDSSQENKCVIIRCSQHYLKCSHPVRFSPSLYPAACCIQLALCKIHSVNEPHCSTTLT